jgi:hypothetical protein
MSLESFEIHLLGLQRLLQLAADAHKPARLYLASSVSVAITPDIVVEETSMSDNKYSLKNG